MKIKFNLQILIFIILFIITRQIKIYGILILFALIHECGHMITGILLGFKPLNLEIMPLGVSVSFNVEPKNYNKKIKKGSILVIKKLIIALMGPITNLVFVIFYCINDMKFLGISREFVIYSNILIGLFNLVPIYPLDGGRIVKNIIHIFYGIKESYKLTNTISNITIILLTAVSSISILYFENIAILIIVVYLWALVIIENKKYRNRMIIMERVEEERLKKVSKISEVLK